MDNYQDNAPHYTQADWNWLKEARDTALTRAKRAEFELQYVLSIHKSPSALKTRIEKFLSAI